MKEKMVEGGKDERRGDVGDAVSPLWNATEGRDKA